MWEGRECSLYVSAQTISPNEAYQSLCDAVRKEECGDMRAKAQQNLHFRIRRLFGTNHLVKISSLLKKWGGLDLNVEDHTVCGLIHGGNFKISSYVVACVAHDQLQSRNNQWIKKKNR